MVIAAYIAPVMYHLGHLCINAGSIHTCLTPGEMFDSFMGSVLSVALFVGKFSTILLAAEGAMHRFNKVMADHPMHRIHFWHTYHRHKAPDVATCKEGDCRVIELQ